MFYRATFGEKLDEQLLSRLSDRRWVATNAQHIYKDKVNIVADLKLVIDGREQEVVIKYFGWRNRISYWLSPLMRSRAKKSWDASWWLLQHGVMVPRPIAVYTRRRSGFIQQNFLLTEKIIDFITARQLLKTASDESLKSALAANLGLIIKRLHQGHYLHRDLTLGNFLVKNEDVTKIFIIDLNRLVRRLFLSRRRRMIDIARMNLCSCRLAREHADCLWRIFLEHYEPEKVSTNLRLLRKALRRHQRRQSLKKKRQFYEKKV